MRQPWFISPQAESSSRLNERIKFSLAEAQRWPRFLCLSFRSMYRHLGRSRLSVVSPPLLRASEPKLSSSTYDVTMTRSFHVVDGWEKREGTEPTRSRGLEKLEFSPTTGESWWTKSDRPARIEGKFKHGRTEVLSRNYISR